MKLFLASVFLLASVTVQAFNGPYGRSTTLKYDGTANSGTLEQHYINVVYRTAGTGAAGSVTMWDTGNDDGFSVVQSSTTAGIVPACMLTVACAQNKLCKCQVYGYSSQLLFDATHVTASAGAQIFISESNAGYAQGEILGTIAASDVPIGVFYDTNSTSGTVDAFLNFR